MNFLKLSSRRLFKKGEHTTIRVISLAAGLAFGILLLSEVFYNFSYDSFYPDANRIYCVQESFKKDAKATDFKVYPKVSGAIAPGMKAEVPGIEAATRLNNIGKQVFYTENKKSYKAKISLADEHWAEVLPRPMISGNPAEILSQPMSCIVSDKVAEEMGGDVVGKAIELKRYSGKEITIGGVFEALPENTNYEYDVLISMVSTGQFWSWDGSTNWMGNDRYYACVKLLPGVNPEDLAPAVRKMQEKHQDIIKMEEEQGGVFFKYKFAPIKKTQVKNTWDMIVILSTIAIAVLFVSLMNYILLTLSVLIKRAKSSAIHKTCGAQASNLQRLIFSETFLVFFISLAAALFIILMIKPFAENQLGHSLSSVINPYVILPLLGLMIALVFLTSYLPGRFFSRIPVATAFRNYKQKKNKWKLGLLAFQFVGASFILTVMVIVSLQYNNMKNSYHGYNTEGVYLGSTTGMDGHKIAMVMNELRSMPEIEKAGLAYEVPAWGAAGNNIKSLDGKKDLFNIADLYAIDENYLSILGIEVTQGNGFSPTTASEGDMLLGQKGADLLKIHNSWNDGIVGKQIEISEHGATTICGIIPDIIIGSISHPDVRPAAFFYTPEERFIQKKIKKPSTPFQIIVKVHKGAEAGVMDKIRAKLNLALPLNDATVYSLEDELLDNYSEEKGFKNAMAAGNIVILLITIIGLLGYTSNEATRRRKELAIRRINGATLPNLLRVFITDLEYIAIPAVLLGLVGAWLVVSRWMQGFATKIPLHWGIFAACSLFIMLLVAFIAAINYSRTANANPVEALRYE